MTYPTRATGTLSVGDAMNRISDQEMNEMCLVVNMMKGRRQQTVSWISASLRGSKCANKALQLAYPEATMTMQLEVSFTGGQLGGALAGDPEELWYALREIADMDDTDIDLVAEHSYGRDGEVVATFLHKLADAIESSTKASA